MSRTSSAWPSSLLTLHDWETLEPDESHHIECAEGILVVAPKPSPRHQHLGMRLGNLLDAALSPDLNVVPAVEVLLETAPLTVRVPDLVAVPHTDYQTNPVRFTGEQIRLAIEIISPGSRRTDQVTKASEYADAGIAEYWVVDPEVPSAVIYDLRRGTYNHRATATTAAAVQACEITLDLDINALL